MKEKEENHFWIFRPALYKDWVKEQRSTRIPALELWIRIFLAPLICLAGGYYINGFLYPLLFAFSISLSNIQKELEKFNFLFFVPNLVLSFAVFWMGVLMWVLFGNFLKLVLGVNMDGAFWFTGIIVFVFTPILLFRLYALFFNYHMKSTSNLLRIALCLILINSSFFASDYLKTDFFELWISDDKTNFPYFVWLVSCCLTLQLLIYSRHIRPDSTSK